MLRLLFLYTLWLSSLWCMGQSPAPNAASAITYTRSINVPLNGLMLHDKATDAWTWTFGKEPGARVLRTDRAGGVLEATGRVNFRSEMLPMREESMGIIQYRVLINVRAGECRITISELTHTGNRTTARGGAHVGLLVNGDSPLERVMGMGGSNTKRLYGEVKDTSNTRITALLQTFEARLRANADP